MTTNINNIESDNNHEVLKVINKSKTLEVENTNTEKKAKDSKKTANQQGGLQIQGGATMESILALLDLQNALLQAMEEYSTFAKDSYNYQMEFAKAAGQCIQKAAEIQGSAQVAAGATMMAMSVGGMIGTKVADIKITKSMESETDAVNKELQPVKSNLEALEKPVDSKLLQTNNKNSLNIKNEQEVKNAFSKLKDTYNKGENGKSEWLDEKGNLKPEYDVRLAEKNPKYKKDFDDLKTFMKDRKEALERKESTLQSKYSSKMGTANNIVQALNGLAQAAGGVINGGATIAKGTKDMLAQIEQAASQQMGSIANQQAQSREQNYQSANNVDQILNQIKKSEIQA